MRKRANRFNEMTLKQLGNNGLSLKIALRHEFSKNKEGLLTDSYKLIVRSNVQANS